MSNDILTMTAKETDQLAAMLEKITAERAANAREIEKVTNNVSAVADSITGKLADIAARQATILEEQKRIDQEIQAIIERMQQNGAN